MDSRVYNGYIAILKHELVPAMGCTEPIAVAFAAAKARDVLGRFPEHITAYPVSYTHLTLPTKA